MLSNRAALAAIPKPTAWALARAVRFSRVTTPAARGIWARGYDAALRGDRFGTCPYRGRGGFGAVATNNWERGYRAAHDDALRAVGRQLIGSPPGWMQDTEDVRVISGETRLTEAGRFAVFVRLSDEERAIRLRLTSAPRDTTAPADPKSQGRDQPAHDTTAPASNI